MPPATMTYSLDTLPLSNSFATLPPALYARVAPTPFETEAHVTHFNSEAAALRDLFVDRERLGRWLADYRAAVHPRDARG